MRYSGLLLSENHELQNIWTPDEEAYYSKKHLSKKNFVGVEDDGLEAYSNVNTYSVMYVNGKKMYGPLIKVPEFHPLFNCYLIYNEDNWCIDRMDLSSDQHSLLQEALNLIEEYVEPFSKKISGITYLPHKQR